MDAPAEIRFRLEGGGELVATRREGMLYALSFTALGSLVAHEPKPEPEPDPDPEPTEPTFTLLKNPPGPIEVRYAGLGLTEGGNPFYDLLSGGNTTYDFRRTVREARLDGVTWRGKGCRSLYRCDGETDPEGQRHGTDHEGGGVAGGAFMGVGVGPEQDWGKLYQSVNRPTGAILFRYCKIRRFIIEAPRIHGGFDGIQMGDKTSDSSDVTILRAAMTMMRDDAVENDNRWDDLVVDGCLFDGFVFYSSRNKSSLDGSKRDNFLRGNVAKLIPVRFEGGMHCGLLFKLDARSPRLNIHDNVFAATGPSWRNFGGAFGDVIERDKLGDSERNLFCWLGEGRNPHEVVRGVTVLEGTEAQQEYHKAVTRFWAAYPGHRFPFDPQLQA